jgi:hypothetical protein
VLVQREDTAFALQRSGLDSPALHQLAHVRWSGCLLGKEALRVRFPTWARSASRSIMVMPPVCTREVPFDSDERLSMRDDVARRYTGLPNRHQGFDSPISLYAAVRTVTAPECHSGREGSTPSGRSMSRSSGEGRGLQVHEARFNSGSALRAKRSDAPSLRARPGGSGHGTSKAVDSFRLRASVPSSFRRIPDRSFRNFVPGSDSRRRDLPASGPGVDATNVDCGRSTRSRETAGWRRFSRQVGP